MRVPTRVPTRLRGGGAGASAVRGYEALSAATQAALTALPPQAQHELIQMASHVEPDDVVARASGYYDFERLLASVESGAVAPLRGSWLIGA